MKLSVAQIAKTVAGLAFLSFLLLCSGTAWPLDFLAIMAFGWIQSLYRKLPQVTVDVSSVAFGLFVLAAFSVGSHLFLAWLCANWGRTGSVADGTPLGPTNPRRVWRVRWTVAGVVGVLLMFVAGMSMVGLVHQLAWLSRTDEILDPNRIHTFKKIKAD